MPEAKYRPYKLSILSLVKNIAMLFYYSGRLIIILLIIIILGAYLISTFDNISFAESLYLSFITGTTVGYGDITPVTYASKVVAVVLGIIGIIFTGIVVAINVEAMRITLKDQLSPEEVDRLKKSRQ